MLQQIFAHNNERCQIGVNFDIGKWCVVGCIKLLTAVDPQIPPQCS